jgi:hypothetical protein
MKNTASIPVHEQIAELRVGAILGTQAIAVYIDSEGATTAHRQASSFDDLPWRLKVRVLAACEDELRRCKEDLIRRGVERGN